MRKDVIELFAGVGGFRVGLNDIHEFDGILYGQINGNHLQEFNMLLNAIKQDLICMSQMMKTIHFIGVIKIFQLFLQISFLIIHYLSEDFPAKTIL